MLVDQVTPEKGYTISNTVLCIAKVNLVKNNLTLEELKEWLPDWYKRLEPILETLATC